MYAYKEQERVSFNKKRKKRGGWTGGNAKTNVGGGAYTIQTIMLKNWGIFLPGLLLLRYRRNFGSNCGLSRIFLVPLSILSWPKSSLYLVNIQSKEWYMIYVLLRISEYQNKSHNHIITWIKISNFNTELLSSFFEMPVFLWKTWTKIKTRWPLQEKIIIIK